MTESVPLSGAAVALFWLHVERKGQIDVADTNRATSSELERAGLVLLRRPCVGEPRYHLTREGLERKGELITRAKPAV